MNKKEILKAIETIYYEIGGVTENAIAEEGLDLGDVSIYTIAEYAREELEKLEEE